MGAHGIGEIGITGVAAAVANAFYNATATHVRDLPITLNKCLPQLQMIGGLSLMKLFRHPNHGGRRAL